MLQESYLFWRIKKGGVGLPIEGMPWKSAMPRWEVELPDEWIWKIISASTTGPINLRAHGSESARASGVSMLYGERGPYETANARSERFGGRQPIAVLLRGKPSRAAAQESVAVAP